MYMNSLPKCQDPAGNWTTWRSDDHKKIIKLQWYCHVSRSSGLAKTILQGTVKGGRRQGGQRKRWEDNIREWAGLEFGKSQRAVENREKWRKLIVKSSVVPQQPSRLRDWWWWWWWWWLTKCPQSSCKHYLLLNKRQVYTSTLALMESPVADCN